MALRAVLGRHANRERGHAHYDAQTYSHGWNRRGEVNLRSTCDTECRAERAGSRHPE